MSEYARSLTNTHTHALQNSLGCLFLLCFFFFFIFLIFRAILLSICWCVTMSMVISSLLVCITHIRTLALRKCKQHTSKTNAPRSTHSIIHHTARISNTIRFHFCLFPNFRYVAVTEQHASFTLRMVRLCHKMERMRSPSLSLSFSSFINAEYCQPKCQHVYYLPSTRCIVSHALSVLLLAHNFVLFRFV